MSKRKATQISSGTQTQAPAAKVQKESIVALFEAPPQDNTFDQSKYQEYSQTSTSMNPVEITVHRTRDWLDLRKLYFEYEAEFYDGANPANLLQAVNPVTGINNLGHSLIKQIKVKLNNSSIIDKNDDHYALRAYLDRLLNFSPAEKDTWLSLEGWYTDDAGKFDQVDPIIPTVAANANMQGAALTAAEIGDAIRTAEARATPNSGAKKRHDLICANRPVKFIISPNIDLFNCPKLIPPGIEMKFEITWNSPEYALMTHAAGVGGANGIANPRFRIVPNTPKLMVRHVMANPDLHVEMESKMLTQQQVGLFPFKSCNVATHTVINGRRNTRMHNIYLGYRPNYVVVGFVHGAAFNGSYTTTPWNFRDVNVESLRLTVDGQELPYPRIETRSAAKEEGFNTWVRFNPAGIESMPVGINRHSYRDGNYLFLFNINPDGEQNFNYEYGRVAGNINIDVDFSANTANDITMIVVSYFEQQLWIDGNKNVALRYDY